MGGSHDPSTAVALAAREKVVTAREQAADLRDRIADGRDEAAKATTEQQAHTETQLLEANENLIVAAVHSQTMAEAAEQSVLRMSVKAERDFLTGLPNRALFSDRLTQSIALARRHRKRVALLYLDLDNFKEINDSLGHSIGDELLMSAARRLEGCVRHSDTVSRHGGDEFVVLLSEIEWVQDAAIAAEKLIRAMAEPHVLGEHRVNVTLSIGICIFPDDGGDAEAVITNADTAMYHVKRNGRNNYERFVPEMNARAAARLVL
jgi:diguanylate cyclase (GGDEF)-like protein